MGRSVHEQPGTEVDRILSQQGGFQVSKGKLKGSKRDEERGNRKQGDCSTNCIARSVFVYIVNACNCLNDCQSMYVCIIISDINVVNNLNCV
jgi:hypothetical protein